MTLIKSISGIRGTIGGEMGENLTPIDIVKFTTAYTRFIASKNEGKRLRIVVGRDARLSGEMVNDIIEGTQKFCEAHPFVNSKKIGCLGASYGGFMTQYLQTRTDIFAAAVSHAGISNVASYWGEGYWGYSYNSIAAAGSYPWNNPELFTNHGSLFNADKINTPLLLLHGTRDTNVPIGESIQLFNALKILGKTVEFISVDGEDHYIADYKMHSQWHDTIMAWFAKWLQDSPQWWEDLYKERHW